MTISAALRVRDHYLTSPQCTRTYSRCQGLCYWAVCRLKVGTSCIQNGELFRVIEMKTK
jgi:hypothetical protein